MHFGQKIIPLVLYDTEGFDIEKNVNIATGPIAKTFESIKKEIHVIFFVVNTKLRLKEKDKNF